MAGLIECSIGGRLCFVNFVGVKYGNVDFSVVWLFTKKKRNVILSLCESFKIPR